MVRELFGVGALVGGGYLVLLEGYLGYWLRVIWDRVLVGWGVGVIWDRVLVGWG